MEPGNSRLPNKEEELVTNFIFEAAVKWLHKTESIHDNDKHDSTSHSYIILLV